MGHGDETEFIYIFESEKVSSLLEHLTSSLDHSEYQIDNAEIDRSAFIDFQDKTFELPIYAISMNHFSSHDDGEDDSCDDKESNAFRPEKDLRKALKPKGKRIEFESGVWCNPKSLLDEDQAERTARIGRKRFRLTHIRIQLELGAKYAKLTLNIWGGVYWGGVHSDPSFKKLTKTLENLSEAWVFKDQFITARQKPPLQDEEEQFAGYCYENDIDDETVDTYARAVLEFEPSEEED